MAPRGVVVLVSPYSWLPGWTPPEKWLGGYKDQASGLLCCLRNWRTWTSGAVGPLRGLLLRRVPLHSAPES